MRRSLALILLLSACAGPKPCTRTLCVTRLDGAMELRGWSGTVRADANSPKPPVPSDSEVALIDGSAEFVNGTTRIFASESAVFRFAVSTAAAASISVSSGSVAVSLSSAAPIALTPGSPFFLPRPR